MEGLRDKIRTILKRLKIDHAPVPIDEVAKLFSLPVINYSYFPENISGTIITEDDINVIGVNSNMAKVRQRFTIAHELGHYLLGHDHQRKLHENFDEPDHRERDANKFASELLMPVDFLENDLKADGITVPQLAKKYEVSEQSMSIRLLETGLLNKIKSA